mmetsp:Transcript_18463/g.53022  ORF Transcript_18463/g.53022 Transcript_18463/m.53022 type:complete len:382 (-) Transcript_18463:277-1422(-)
MPAACNRLRSTTSLPRCPRRCTLLRTRPARRWRHATARSKCCSSARRSTRRTTSESWHARLAWSATRAVRCGTSSLQTATPASRACSAKAQGWLVPATSQVTALRGRWPASWILHTGRTPVQSAIASGSATSASESESVLCASKPQGRRASLLATASVTSPSESRWEWPFRTRRLVVATPPSIRACSTSPRAFLPALGPMMTTMCTRRLCLTDRASTFTARRPTKAAGLDLPRRNWTKSEARTVSSQAPVAAATFNSSARLTRRRPTLASSLAQAKDAGPATVLTRRSGRGGRASCPSQQAELLEEMRPSLARGGQKSTSSPAPTDALALAMGRRTCCGVDVATTWEPAVAMTDALRSRFVVWQSGCSRTIYGELRWVFVV